MWPNPFPDGMDPLEEEVYSVFGGCTPAGADVAIGSSSCVSARKPMRVAIIDTISFPIVFNSEIGLYDLGMVKSPPVGFLNATVMDSRKWCG